MRTRLFPLAVAASILVAGLPLVPAPVVAQTPNVTVKAGYGEADNTWHVGAGAGQYSDKSADSVQGLADQGEIDPHNHSTTQKNSYGVQSRLSFRAIVVEDAEGDHVAFVKSDNYLAMDYLLRRAGQILAAEGSQVSYDEIMHMASHNHYSPMYSTPSWGVWAFQDAMDIRAYEYQARQMAAAILDAEANLQPAVMGATEVDHYLFKGMVARRSTAHRDGTPVGYPLDFGDFGLPVIRFDNAETGAPIATLINWGMHPEGLDADDLITAEFLAPLERFVERETGAPLVFGQGDVGSAESGPARPYHPDWPKGVFRQWDNAGHAQVERGAYLLSQDVARGWNQIGNGDARVPFSGDFDVAAGNAWVPGPKSHPYPSFGNCKTETNAEGRPAAPGLPTCTEPGGPPAGPQDMLWESLKAHGLPLPEHYSPPAFTGVEENLRLHLQAFKMGEVILMSCACEAQVDLILNLESRTNETEGDMYLGYKWWERLDCTQNADTSWSCKRKQNDTPDGASHPTSPGSTYAGTLTFSDAAMKRMKAQVLNDAAGWNDPENIAWAEAEPSDPTKIWGNFTHTELSADEGYALPVGVGHAGDYNGYTVSYREYVAYDHYRKALTAYGPHTADYMNTVLMELARELNQPDGDHRYNLSPEDQARADADEARQETIAQALGKKSAAAYDAWRAAIPNDVGPAEAVSQPGDIERFDSTTFSWRGGSNAVDNPVVTVERLVDGEWTAFADQSGEIQTMVEFPEGVNGFAQTYAGNEEWIWTANFEAFNALPKGIGSTPAGTYRFVVEGHIRQNGETVTYGENKSLTSNPFNVKPFNGVEVGDLTVNDDGSVSFTADSTYPLIDNDAAFPYVRMHTKSERGTGDEIMPGDQKSWCDTCSFRPWATRGEVEMATVTVERADGSTEQVEASKGDDGRWHAATDLYAGDRAYVAEGGVQDEYGESNSQRSETADGTREPPTPTPTVDPTGTVEPTPTEEPPAATTVEFSDASARAVQYSDEATIEAVLNDDEGPVEGADVTFELIGAEGTKSWTATTDETGVASTSFVAESVPGAYTLTARYAGTETRLGSADVESFTVDREDTTLALAVVGKGNSVNLEATLRDADSSAGVGGRAVSFSADGTDLGTSTTSNNGVASVTLPPRYRNGHHDYTAVFDGDTYYLTSRDARQT